MHAIQRAVAGFAVDRNRRVLVEKRGGPFANLTSLIRGDCRFAFESQIDPGLKVLGSKDDLLSHLEVFDVQKRGGWCVILTPQRLALEARVPRVGPIELQHLRRRKVPKVVHGNARVIRHETDVGDDVSGFWVNRRNDLKRLRPVSESEAQFGTDDEFRVAVFLRQGLASDFVPNDTLAYVNSDNLADELLVIRNERPF